MSGKGAIKMVTPVKEITKYLGEELEKDQQKIAQMLSYVGERCVSESRTNGSYQDRTGNLRNSIGYVVLLNGRIYSQNTGNRSETQSLLAEIMPQFQNGVALIVAAGMHYSGYVEARGFNVITSSRLLAQRLVPQMLTQIGFTKQ
jgi:hypothetical protein